MQPSRLSRFSILGIAIAIAGVAILGWTRSRHTPQYIAKKYAAAFLKNDSSTAVDLLHPSALFLVRSKYLDALSQAKKQNVMKEYLEALGLKESAEEIEQLSPKELFIALNRNRYNGKQNLFNISKQIRLDVVSINYSSSETVTVQMKAIPSSKVSEGVDLSFYTGFELQRAGTEWKVLRDVPELCTLPSAP